jgi:hypothetical protein
MQSLLVYLVLNKLRFACSLIASGVIALNRGSRYTADKPRNHVIIVV